MKLRRISQARARGTRGAREGWVLVFAVFTTFVALAMVGVMLTDSLTTSKSTGAERDVTSARYLAEAGVDVGQRDLLAAVAAFDPAPAGGNAMIDGHVVPFTITPSGFNAVITDANGINSVTTGYEIEAQATVDQTLRFAHRMVNVDAIPIFQFAVFYDDDLEMLPGPNMTLSGRVHTNGDMYIGSGATLTLNTNYVQAIGQMFRNRKDDPTQSTGTVRIRNWVADPFNPAEPAAFFNMNSAAQMGAVPTTGGYDSNFTSGWDSNGDGDFVDPGDWYPWVAGALEYWKEPAGYGTSGHTVLSGEHGTQFLVTPKVGSIAMFEPQTSGNYALDPTTKEYVQVAPGTGTHDKGYFHANADLVIVTHANGTWNAYDGSGADVTVGLPGVVKVKSIYDARQGGYVRVTEVNMALLNASGLFPANGLLYASSYGMGTGTKAKGLKLVNGSELAKPLTVVTEGPMYVKGDYNTVNKKGAAVMSDAVNLLSNKWSDSKTPGTLPAATETTYNVAIVTGNHETSVGGYNGGFENLPRFHERWSGVRCNITGSFVNLWKSTVATGAWKYGGDVYEAPNRNWAYDPAFNSLGNLPPFTPMAMRANEVVSW